MIYSVTATVTRDDGRSLEIPTFYLNSDVQGFTDESGACAIARTIIDPFGLYNCHITAVQITDSFGNY